MGEYNEERFRTHFFTRHPPRSFFYRQGYLQSQETRAVECIVSGLQARQKVEPKNRLNSWDSTGQTPLYHAALSGLTEVVQVLLDAGADPGGRTFFGTVPTQAALVAGHWDVVEQLQRAGVAPDLSLDRWKRTLTDYGRDYGRSSQRLQPGVHQTTAELVMSSSNAGCVEGGTGGWSTLSTVAMESDEHYCEFESRWASEITPAEYERDFLSMGRPLLLRGLLDAQARCPFSKASFLDICKDLRFRVGPTAYPKLTGQENCQERYSMEEVSVGISGDQCPEHPNAISFATVKPPEHTPIWDLFKDGKLPSANAEDKLRALLEPVTNYGEMKPSSLQMFFGADKSGAAPHCKSTH